MKSSSSFTIGLTGFLVGGIAGGIAAMLFTPKNGTETRHDIHKYSRYARLKKRRILADARNRSREIVSRAEEIMDKSRVFAEGKYAGTLEGFEKELESLKNGFNAALEAYKNYPTAAKSTERMIDEMFIDYEDSSLRDIEDYDEPKREGMGRRRQK